MFGVTFHFQSAFSDCVPFLKCKEMLTVPTIELGSHATYIAAMLSNPMGMAGSALFASWWFTVYLMISNAFSFCSPYVMVVFAIYLSHIWQLGFYVWSWKPYGTGHFGFQLSVGRDENTDFWFSTTMYIHLTVVYKFCVPCQESLVMRGVAMHLICIIAQ